MGLVGQGAGMAGARKAAMRKAPLPDLGRCMPIPALCDRIPVHNNLHVIDSGKAHRADCVYSACAIPVPNMRRGLAKGEIEASVLYAADKGTGIMPARRRLRGPDKA